MPLFFVGLAATISLRSLKKKSPIPIKAFSILWLITFAVELTGHITQQLGIRNHALYNVFNFFFYLALAFIFQHKLTSQLIKRVIRYFYPLFVIFVIVNSIFIQGVTNFQTLTVVTGGGFIILLAAFYFRELYESEETENIAKDPFFWISFGLIVYLGGTVPFLGMLNYLWDNFKDFTRFYFVYISNAFSIFLNILVAIGFLCRKNYQKSP